MNQFFLLVMVTMLSLGAYAEDECANFSLDCAKREGSIGGETFKLSCGPGTGAKMNGKGKIKGLIKGAGGPLSDGSKGYDGPMLQSDPELCPNCFIHVGATTPGANTKGCIGVEDEIFKKLVKCAGLDPSQAQTGKLEPARKPFEIEKIVPESDRWWRWFGG